MIGDDVVIGAKEAADSYLQAMKLLGVEISLAKSVMSDDGNSFEFTKRNVMDGKEVSPIP
jgi:ATP-dependent RNA circularization protein (DNA/RNA ligase family)